MSQDQPVQVELDARAVIAVIQQSHPDLVAAAMWRVRAEMAEAMAETLRAELKQLQPDEPTPS